MQRASFPVSELQYVLPEQLIAQEPCARGSARLLVVHRAERKLEDRSILDLGRYLRRGDVLVMNDTRVLPAKFTLRRSSGGRIEGLFVSGQADGQWSVLLKGAGRLAVGEALEFEGAAGAWTAVAAERCGGGRWLLEVPGGGSPAEVLAAVGRMPLPPYIKRDKVHDVRDAADREWYQTVVAARDGAVAAPTAGLHFTAELLAELTGAGIALERVTLHVGPGTFAPVETEDLAAHEMHAEYFEMEAAVGQRLEAARASAGRIVAVGTTSARVMETVAGRGPLGAGGRGWTDIFCYPPFEFRGVDVLLTNFHLPRSTLLALVMAFAGRELTRGAYAHAVAQRYRFFSYGDAMLLL